MLKFLIILLALGVLAYMIARPLLKATAPKNGKKDNGNAEEMRQCNACGVYVSTHEAFIANGRFYCSKECMNKGEA